MKTKLPITILLALAALASTASAAANDPEAVVSAFHRALTSGEKQSVLDLLDPKVVIFESGGAELSRDEYASHHLGSDMVFAAAIEAKVLDQRSGGTEETAWVLTRTETTGTFRDKEIDSLGVETMVLQRSGDKWKIVHIHWSSRSRKASH